MEIQSNKSLHELNTFKVKSEAKYFAEIFSADDLLELLSGKKIKNEKKLIVSGGSNILFTKNFDGLIIKNSIPGITVIEENNDTVLIEAGSGVNWDELVQFCVERNYGGVENLSLIPGTVGAAPIQNIGAYGQEISDSFQNLKGVFIDSLEDKIFNKEECGFSYRNSIFKNELKNKFVVTSVQLNLKKNPVIKTGYGEIEQLLDKEKIITPTVMDIRKIVVEIRKNKLPDPEMIGNAGSFFKNPVVDEDIIKKLKSKYDDIAAFKLGKHSYKISAGWLIEKCGWKGKRVGNTGTYFKHALILVNHNSASGMEIFDLAMQLKEEVKSKFGIILEEEVNII